MHGLHCMAAWVALHDSMGCIAWQHGLHCMGCIAWVALHGLHCMDCIASVVLHKFFFEEGDHGYAPV